MKMMIDIERWYRRCLERLDCELIGDRADQIKNALYLFVEEPDWLQYVLQESGWFEQKAMVAALSKMGNADISLTINNPVWVSENLFLDRTGSANKDVILFVYGEQLSEDACQFLEFLGWSDRAEVSDVQFGLTAFESTLFTIQRGDWKGVTNITELMLYKRASKVKAGILTGSQDFTVNGEHGKMSAEQVSFIIRPYLGHKAMNPASSALELRILHQIIADPKVTNLDLYNKVANAIEEADDTGNFDGELKVVANKKADDKGRPKVILRYAKRGHPCWSEVTAKGFETQVLHIKNALKKRNLNL